MKRVLSVLVIPSLSATWASRKPVRVRRKASLLPARLTDVYHPNEFLLKANDGSSWKVRSDTVALAEHVGQTVSATGAVSNPNPHNVKEDAQDMAQDTGMTKHNAKHGHLTITDLQTINGSCSQ